MKKKHLKYITTFFLLSSLSLVILATGCNKEKNEYKEEYSVACGIEYPLTNIEWLKEKKNALKSDSQTTSASISLYSLNDTDYILIHKSLSSVYDYPDAIVYDCKGNEIYVCGGNQDPAIDTCSNFFSNAQKIQTLWKK